MRIKELDGLRGIAVLLVLVHHYVTGSLKLDLGGVGNLLLKVTEPFFLSGVDLFFVISGFIVGGIVIDNIHTSGFFRSFYIRRTTRIFPLYFGMYALFFIAYFINVAYPNPMGIWLVNDKIPIWSYAVFMQNYFMGLADNPGGRFFAMAWSVATEEHFYLLFPILLRFIKLKWMSVVCMGLLIICPLVREYAAAKWGFYASYLPFPARADSIAYGVLIAMAVRQWPEFVKSQKFLNLARVGLCVTGALLVGFTLDVVPLGPGSRFSLLAVFHGLLLMVGVLGEGTISTTLRSKTLLYFGYISYPLYMYHQLVNGLAHGYILGQAPQINNVQSIWVTAASTIAVIILAHLSTKYLEAPIRAYGYSLTKHGHRTVRVGTEKHD